MEVHPIDGEAGYRVAMARIDALWGAAPGTPEADELEVLVTLVDAYEAQHHGIAPPEPSKLQKG